MLLAEVKEELKITWDDEDSSLEKTITRGKDNINDLAGVELDFELNSQAKTLLLNYCRYDYNNALEYFEDNFHKEIFRLQLSEGVKQDATQEG